MGRRIFSQDPPRIEVIYPATVPWIEFYFFAVRRSGRFFTGIALTFHHAFFLAGSHASSVFAFCPCVMIKKGGDRNIFLLYSHKLFKFVIKKEFYILFFKSLHFHLCKIRALGTFSFYDFVQNELYLHLKISPFSSPPPPTPKKKTKPNV